MAINITQLGFYRGLTEQAWRLIDDKLTNTLFRVNVPKLKHRVRLDAVFKAHHHFPAGTTVLNPTAPLIAPWMAHMDELLTPEGLIFISDLLAGTISFSPADILEAAAVAAGAAEVGRDEMRIVAQLAGVKVNVNKFLVYIQQMELLELTERMATILPLILPQNAPRHRVSVRYSKRFR